MNVDNTISVIALRSSQEITFTSLPTSTSVGGSTPSRHSAATPHSR